MDALGICASSILESKLQEFDPNSISDRTLVALSYRPAKYNPMREYKYHYLYPFRPANLNWGITYEFAFVVMLPQGFDADYLSAGMIILDTGSLNELTTDDEHTVHDKPRDEWIRLLAGRHKKSDDAKRINFFLRGLKLGIIIKGIIMEPVF